MQKRNSDKLQHAIRSLDAAIKYSRSSEFQGIGIEFKTVLVSAVAQNFHLTFAVCLQMLVFQLSDRLGAKAVENIASDALLQMAAKEGMIAHLNHWLEYLDCDSTQSGNAALRAFEKAPAFLEDACELLRTCTTRSQNERRRVA